VRIFTAAKAAGAPLSLQREEVAYPFYSWKEINRLKFF